MNKPVFHVVVQGIFNGEAFDNDLKKEMYWERIQRYKEELGLHLYAFSIFDNHAHFLLRGTREEVSDMMRRVGVSFSHWYRRHYCHEGTLFRGRPQMEELTYDGDILKACRFIHQEPVREGFASSMEAYPWSSYWMYRTGEEVINRDEITERLRFWGRFEDYMNIRETAVFLEEKEVTFGRTDEEAERMIRNRLQGRPFRDLFTMPVEMRNYTLAVLRYVDHISILQLSRVSGVGRGIVQRINRHDLELTLFRGTEVIRLQGETIPKRIMDQPNAWYVLAEKRQLINPADMLIPRTDAMQDWLLKGKAEHPLEEAAAMAQNSRYVQAIPSELVYVERTLPSGEVRKGIVGCLDLEACSGTSESELPIRPLMESDLGGVLKRLHEREVYRVEWPQTVLLADDPEDRLIGPLAHKTDLMKPLYEVHLPEGQGEVKGYIIPREIRNKVMEVVEVLSDPGYFANRYKSNEPSFALITASGGKDLAAASMHYEQLKLEAGTTDPLPVPARFALVEIVNLRDPAIHLETAYPVVSGMDTDMFMQVLQEHCPEAHYGKPRKGEIAIELVLSEDIPQDRKKLCFPVQSRRKSQSRYPLGRLLPAINEATIRYGGRVQLVPEAEEAIRTAEQEGGFALVWDPVSKNEVIEELIHGRIYPEDALIFGLPGEKRVRMEARSLLME